MDVSIWFWVLFIAIVLLMLALDLGVFHRRPHAVGFREAAIWTTAWILVALLFNGVIYLIAGPGPALEFLAGYLIEKSLSVDNIFVFAVIFSSFGVPPKYQHRILFWGILGALVMRGIIIGIGVYLIQRFHWIIYVFGAFLVLTGIRLALRREEKIDLERKFAIRLVRKILPVTTRYHGPSFFVKEGGRRYATPLFLVLVLVETTDLIFAIDSIPAVFAVTQDPFLVYTSNIFAVLGLRSLYFLVADVIERFYRLKYGLALILVFVGFKMLLSDVVQIPVGISLAVVVLIMTAFILLSLRSPAPPGAARRR